MSITVPNPVNPSDEEQAVRRSVDAQFPLVAELVASGRQGTGTVPNPVSPSDEELWNTPLPDLYERLNVQLGEFPSTDPDIFGAVLVRAEGITLLLAPGRSEFETDCVARKLLSDAIGGGLPEIGGSFETSVLPFGDSDPDIDEALRRVRSGDAR